MYNILLFDTMEFHFFKNHAFLPLNRWSGTFWYEAEFLRLVAKFNVKSFYLSGLGKKQERPFTISSYLNIFTWVAKLALTFFTDFSIYFFLWPPYYGNIYSLLFLTWLSSSAVVLFFHGAALSSQLHSSHDFILDGPSYQQNEWIKIQ